MECMERKELMRKIQRVEFTAVELNLYLDNHPENKKALADYNAIANQLKELKKMYTDSYGPLTNFGDCPSQYPWAWINDPWPWESGE